MLRRAARAIASAISSEDVQPALARLLERVAHDRRGVTPPILMSIWTAVTPSAVPATLKSMSPRWSSSPRMSVEDADLVALLDEAHRDAGDRRLDRHARVHERERAAADRRHRRRAVRFEDLGDDADRVRELASSGRTADERALGERAVTDLATARAAQELHLADAERREVVVQHELLVVLAERARRSSARRTTCRAWSTHQRLRLAAREERRAVRARQHADLAA